MSRIEELERRVRQDPASITFGALAEEYRRAGRLDDAVAVCRTGLERHPSYLSARVTLGRALQDLGQSADARAEFDYVLSLAPDNLAAIRGLAEMHGGPEEYVPAPVQVAAPAPIAVAAPMIEEPIVEEPVAEEPIVEAAPLPDTPMHAREPDLLALDASIDQAAGSQRAAQIERLEIWLVRLEELRNQQK